MKRNWIKYFVAFAFCISLVFCFAGCGSGSSGDDVEQAAPTAAAANGTYIGHENNGIQEFLGIRYGEFEPFKPAADLTTTTEDEFEAAEFGENCIQPYDEVELASQDPCSQDCLFLNVWTKDIATTDKPVIVWIHGGSNIWGGATDPMYDGEQFVRNLPDGEDCVFVTINYRLAFMGGIDMSSLEGYTDEYQDAVNLRHLDRVQALKWVNQNIDAFGGNPDNVTVVGQSSGAMAVQCLMLDKNAQQYFNRGIECSGVMGQVTATDEDMKEMSQAVFDTLDIKSVDDLISLTDEDISSNMDALFKAGGISGAIYLDDRILPKDWLNEWKNGAAKDIDYMVTSVSGEHDYLAVDYDNFPEAIKDEEVMKETLAEETHRDELPYGYMDPSAYDGLIDNYLALNEDKIMGYMDLINDTCFTYPNVIMASEQSKWNPNTYMYYWEYSPAKEDVIEYSGEAAEVSPWSRPQHSMDTCFFFGTLEDGYTELTGDASKLPDGLMEKTQSVYYNFAKTGDPNNDLVSGWKPYDTESKSIMVIKPDAEWECISDYRGDYFDVLSPMRPYGEQ